MNEGLLSAIILLYFGIVGIISYLSTKRVSAFSFFTADRNAPWYIVAYGMIGTTLSGVTFISVPGTVVKTQFSYFQIVLGYFAGYLLIAYVLLPLYYQKQWISIYGFLGERFHPLTQKLGASFFLLSRLLGTAARLYLAIIVLQKFIFSSFHIPLWLTTALSLAFILLYTYQGGIKTVIWTDLFQTTAMIVALIGTLWILMKETQIPILELWHSPKTKIFHWEASSSPFFPKAFFTGALIALSMTGLDQDQMQKNLTIRTLSESQRNMITYALFIVILNFFFLLLGAYLFQYAERNAIDIGSNSDQLFPTIALSYLPTWIGIAFIIGVVAATYSSADGSLTALTTSFCIDILQATPSNLGKKRYFIHALFTLATLLIVLIIDFLQSRNTPLPVIDIILRMAAYTYGPLLGLYAFGILTSRQVHFSTTIYAMLLPPLIALPIDLFDQQWLHFSIGHELILYIAILTFLILYLLSKRRI